MNHPWFSCVNWENILLKKVRPPFVPKLSSEEDLRYIDHIFTDELVDEATPRKIGSSSSSSSTALSKSKFDSKWEIPASYYTEDGDDEREEDYT